MSDETDISDELAASKIVLVGDLVRDLSEGKKFYAFVNVSRDKKGAQRPSNYKLRRLSESFEQKGWQVAFVLVENDREDVQGSVKTALFRFFPDIVRNAFVSYNDKSITVWVEPKKVLTNAEEDALTSKTEELLQVMDIQLEAVRITSSENVPTRTACLNAIRLKSPVTLQELQTVLTERGFHIPNIEWLSKMLDSLRKFGVILRRKNGQFILTLDGLKSLGTAKNRRSPDISRALDLVRRRP